MEKLANIQARDGYSKNLTSSHVAKVYQGLDQHAIQADTFLLNIFHLQVFWSRKEV